MSWPHILLANDDGGFSPQLFILVDESGSMEGGQSWLAEVLPDLRTALDKRNMNDRPDDIYFTLAGFTDASRELVRHASAIEAALAVSALRIDLGGTEDGYVAIRDALSGYLAGGDYAPTTVLLITDEDRDATERDLTLARMTDLLVTSGIVVHAITRAYISCPDHGPAIAADKDGSALAAGRGDRFTCADASTKTHEDYAELAWATGGLVWDLNIFVNSSENKITRGMRPQAIAALADKIVSQWPAGALWTEIGYRPLNPKPGDVVTFDGSDSVSNKPGARIVDWKWDLDGDGTIDQSGPTVSEIFFAPGRYQVELTITDDSDPPGTGRKVVVVEVSEQ